MTQSLFSKIFSSTPVQQPNQQQQPTNDQNQSGRLDKVNQQLDTKNSDGTAPNGVVPNNDATKKEESPLDQFSTLWETNPDDKKSAEFVPETLDLDKLKEIISKQDLTTSIPQELQSKINAGGEEANAAMLKIINHIAQQTMMQSTLAANKMLEVNSNKLVQAMMAKLPSLIKDHNVNNNLQEQNPLYSNPAVAPIIDAVRSQLTTKYPNATPKQLTEMANNFIDVLATSFKPNTPNDTTGIPKEEDFSEWA